MKFNKDHFIAQDDGWKDALNDVAAINLSPKIRDLHLLRQAKILLLLKQRSITKIQFVLLCFPAMPLHREV